MPERHQSIGILSNCQRATYDADADPGLCRAVLPGLAITRCRPSIPPRTPVIVVDEVPLIEIDRASVRDVLAAVAAANAQGVSIETIRAGLVDII